MIQRQYKQIYKIFIFLVILIFSCSKEKNAMMEFYNQNKDNADLLSFDAVHIAPARGMHTIRLFKYGGVVFRVAGYDESNEPSLDIIHGNESFKLLNDQYNLKNDAALTHLSNLYSIFNDLDVLAVFGMPNCTYIKFIVDNYNVVIYVPDRGKLTTSVLNDINELEKKADIKFDEHWFTYKLDKPFSFSG